VISTISKKQDDNIDKTIEQTNKLSAENRSAVSGFFTRLFRLLFGLVVFGSMIVFIKFFPNKRYIQS